MNTISNYREQLNQLDLEITELLEKRFKITDAIGMEKIKSELPIEDQIREKVVLSRIKLLLNESIYLESILSIYNTIIHESKKNQQKIQD